MLLPKDYTGIIQQQELEKLLFGTAHYLDMNVFVTSHQIANVYTRPAAHYEVRCDEKSIDIQVDENVKQETQSSIDGNSIDNGNRGDVRKEELSEGNEISSKSTEEINTIDSSNQLDTTQKTPTFGITKIGEYSVELVGKVDNIIHIIKKYGGCQSSKKMIYEKVTYTGGYIIPSYNLERFLQFLREEGWAINKLAKSLGFH